MVTAEPFECHLTHAIAAGDAELEKSRHAEYDEWAEGLLSEAAGEARLWVARDVRREP